MHPTTRQQGTHGEAMAVNYLESLGHRIIDRNFHTKWGELDLVTYYNRDIFIFEVKYRTNQMFGYGEEAISRSKIEKLRKTTQIWINKHSKKYLPQAIYLNALIIDEDGSIRLYEIL